MASERRQGDSMDRLTRDEAAAYLMCSRSKLYRMEQAGLLTGTFYDIGAGLRNRRLYIKDKLDEWMLAGGEPAALERKAQQANRIRFG